MNIKTLLVALLGRIGLFVGYFILMHCVVLTIISTIRVISALGIKSVISGVEWIVLIPIAFFAFTLGGLRILITGTCKEIMFTPVQIYFYVLIISLVTCGLVWRHYAKKKITHSRT